MSDDLREAMELEKHLIAPDKWKNELRQHGEVVPAEIYKDLFGPSGGPIGLGRHPEKGLFVLASGQGPCIVWTEWEKN